MSELTLMLIRFAYLAILWIFVLSAISVVRSGFSFVLPSVLRTRPGDSTASTRAVFPAL